MSFTPQQLSGGVKYSSVTRIGNWNEDLVLEEYKTKEFQVNKKLGKLSNYTHQEKLKQGKKKVQLSSHSDGYLYYGDYINIVNPSTKGMVVCDPWEEIIPDEYTVTLTTDTNFESTTRTAFRIVPVLDMLPETFDNIVNNNQQIRYGEPFRIICNEILRPIHQGDAFLKSPLYICSTLKSERHISPYTGNQLVTMSHVSSPNTIWYFIDATSAGAEKYLKTNQPVHTNDIVSIVHKMTGQQLYSDGKTKHLNDYGLEYEISCNIVKNAGRCANLLHEKEGTCTPNLLGKQALAENSWRIMINVSLSTSYPSNKQLLPFPTIKGILEYIRKFLNNKIVYGYRGLHQILRAIDKKQVRKIEREDIKWGMRKYGITLSDEVFDIFFDGLDKDRSEYINVTEFWNVLRGAVPNFRIQLINEIYEILEKKLNTPININQLSQIYNPEGDPRLTQKGENISKEDIKDEFISLWTVIGKTSNIAKDEFVGYYCDISATFNDDKSFEKYMKDIWRKLFEQI